MKNRVELLLTDLHVLDRKQGEVSDSFMVERGNLHEQTIG